MKNLQILLCCGNGMSSGFLATSARKYAKKNKIAASIEAKSVTEAEEYLSSIDILMLGPHYASSLEKYQKMAKPYHVAVVVIPSDIYGELDGERLVKLAIETIEQK